MACLRALVHPIWEEVSSGRLRVVLDPGLATVARGYAILTGEDGRLVRSVAQASPGERVQARLPDGHLRMRVEERIGTPAEPPPSPAAD